jgi:hypothetical protein
MLREKLTTLPEAGETTRIRADIGEVFALLS